MISHLGKRVRVIDVETSPVQRWGGVDTSPLCRSSISAALGFAACYRIKGTVVTQREG